MDDERLEKSESGKIQVTRVYIKSEVDAAIAELKAQVNGLRNCANLWLYNAQNEHNAAVAVRMENAKLKAKIAENDKEIAKLKEQYKDMDVTHTVQIAKMNGYISHLEEERRWRNVDDNLPTDDEGYILVLWEDGLPDIGYIGAEDDVIETVRDRGEGHSVEWWMPLPSAPKEEK